MRGLFGARGTGLSSLGEGMDGESTSVTENTGLSLGEGVGDDYNIELGNDEFNLGSEMDQCGGMELGSESGLDYIGDKEVILAEDIDMAYAFSIDSEQCWYHQENNREDYLHLSEKLPEIQTEVAKTEEMDLNQTEISKVEYEIIWQETSQRTFITNGRLEVQDGEEILKDEEITYENAVNRLSGKALHLLTEVEKEQDIHFSEMDKEELKARIDDALIKQQVYTDKRGIGEHGIKHIYSNIERSDFALEQQDVSAGARLAAFVAQIYHDEGYTVDKIHNKEWPDKEHDKISLQLFEENQKEFYQRFFVRDDGTSDQERMDAVLDSIGTHNEARSDKIRENTNPEYKGQEKSSFENHLIVTAVHIADKCALSENEKLMDMYENKEIMSLLTRVYETGKKTLHYKKTLQEELANNPPDDTITRDALRNAVCVMEQTEVNLKEKMKCIIDENIISDELKQSFKEAVDKDISLISEKYTAPMNDIALSNQAFELVKEEGEVKARVTIHVFDFDEAKVLLGEDLAQKQVTKVFGDMGVSEKNAAAMAMRAISGEPQELKEQNIIIQIKKIRSDQIENNHKRRAVRQEVNEGIELAKQEFLKAVNQEKKRMCDSISDQLAREPEHITKHDLNKLVKLNYQGTWEMKQRNMRQWKQLLERCSFDINGMATAAKVIVAQTYASLTNSAIYAR